MANMSIKYEIAKHATANPSNVLSGGTYGRSYVFNPFG